MITLLLKALLLVVVGRVKVVGGVKWEGVPDILIPFVPMVHDQGWHHLPTGFCLVLPPFCVHCRVCGIS